MNRMYLVLGDWSDDGHGKSDKVLVDANKTVEEIQNAYKASCKLTGISFNHNEDFTERDRDWREANRYHVCTEYEDSKLTVPVIDILKEYNCPLEDFCDIDEDDYYVDDFTGLWFWFVKLSLPDLEVEFPEVKDKIPVINGYWDKNLNVQFGYGLYW